MRRGPEQSGGLFRRRTDAADAEAICEGPKPLAQRSGDPGIDGWRKPQRPGTRFVPVKSGETQGAASVFRVRELLIRQRTQAINALRGHLGECGWVVPQGAANVRRLVAVVADEDLDLPEAARASLQVLTATLAQLDGQIETLDAGIDRRARENKVARRLMGSARRCLKTSTGGFAAGADRPELPGIGPLTATAIATLAPPPGLFRKGRDFAAA